MAKRGAGARQKGANFERTLANYLTENTSLIAKRGLAQTRGGGAEVSDVDIKFIHVEAKNHKRCNIKAALEQAINDSAANGKLPVAITKDLRKPILCTMLLEDWLKLFNSFVEIQRAQEQENI